MNEPFQLQVCDLTSLNNSEKKEMISFANKVLPLEDTYFIERFSLYDQVIFLKKNERLCSFQFLQHFEEKNELYLYFGPLFSRMNFYLPMFLSYFDDIERNSSGKEVHLLAEIQNPEVFLLFKALFGTFSYPHLDQETVPLRMKEIVHTFTKNVSHIHNVHLENFSTSGAETLYRKRMHHPIIQQWLKRRGLDFSTGQSQLLLVSVPADQNERDTLLKQLQSGVRLTKNWKQGKEVILQQFQEGLLHV